MKTAWFISESTDFISEHCNSNTLTEVGVGGTDQIRTMAEVGMVGTDQILVNIVTEVGVGETDQTSVVTEVGLGGPEVGVGGTGS